MINVDKVLQIIRFSFSGISGDQWRKHILLFALTGFSTFLTGLEMAGNTVGLQKILLGLSYSLPVMLILTGHELGHYIVARMYGVNVSLPYFIPLPILSPFGTMGAFIRMRGLPMDKRSLFDVAFWGPAMSFMLSIPFAIAGILLSEVKPIPPDFGGMYFGDSIFFKWLISLFHQIPPGHDLFIHPMAFAAWVGFFITAINLFPIGQLDGGHIAYAMFGRNQKWIAMVFLGFLVLLTFFHFGWFIWLVLLYFMGIFHPPVQSGAFDLLDHKRMRLGYASLVVLVLCFIPIPIEFKEARDFIPERQQESVPLPYNDEYNVYLDQPESWLPKMIGSTSCHSFIEKSTWKLST